MTDEKPLTLEEIARVVETMTDWHGDRDWYFGTNESLGVIAHRGVFPFSKIREVSVYNRESNIELGCVRGKEISPLYTRSEELYLLYRAKEKQKRVEERNEELRRIREVILKVDGGEK